MYSLIEIWDSTVEDCKNKAFLKVNGKSFSYEQIDIYSENIKNQLINIGVNKGMRIAISLDVNEDLIIYLIAILKLEASYVALPKDIPFERRKLILEQSNCDLFIVNQQCMLENVPTYNIRTKTMNGSVYQKNNDDNFAYIIFTSGSTGKPKGVPVKHSSVCQLLNSTNSLFNFSKNQKWTLFHSYAFDFSVWEIWGCIYNGAELHLLNDNQKNLSKLSNYLYQNQISILNITPMAFYNLIELSSNLEYFDNLEYVIFGGDKLDLAKLSKIRKNIDSNTKFINMYGITEITIHGSFKELNNNLNLNESNIGKPLKHLNFHLINDKNEIIKSNFTTGELVITGQSIAEHYINNKNKSNMVFVENIFDSNGSIAYITGDLAYKNKDGDFIYVDRKDKQIQLRGYRIELEEVENQIKKMDYVSDVILKVINENSTNYLDAFILSKENIEGKSIKKFLKRYLPDYMIPTNIYVSREYPLNNNGKIDFNIIRNQNSLNIDNGYNDDFTDFFINSINNKYRGEELENYSLDSVKVMKLLADIYKKFNKEVRISEFYSFSTIEELKKFVFNDATFENSEFSFRNQKHINESQKRIYFEHIKTNTKHLYNVNWEWTFPNNQIETKIIERNFNRMLKEQPFLTSNFKLEDGKLSLNSNEKKGNIIYVNDFKKYKEHIHDLIYKNYDLYKDILFDVIIFKDDENVKLFFNFHHIIIDGHSKFLIYKYLFENYSVKIADEANFDDFISKRMLYEEPFHQQNTFNGYSGYLSKYTDKDRYSYHGNLIQLEKNVEFKKWNSIKKKYRVTDYIILINLLENFLYRYYGNKNVSILTISDNRREGLNSNTINCYINNLLYSNDFQSYDFKHSIYKTKNKILDLIDNQWTPFNKVIKNSNINNISRYIDIFFVYQSYNNLKDISDNIDEKTYFNHTAKFPLSLICNKTDYGFELNFEYSTELFDGKMIAIMIEEFSNYWDNYINENLELLVSDFLPTNEDNKKLSNLNLYELFIKNSDSSTVIETEDRTYSKEFIKNAVEGLAEKINAYFEKHTTAVRHLVIDVNKRVEGIISMLACSITGCQYTCLDRSFPFKRVIYILEDFDANLILKGSNNNVLNIKNVEEMNFDIDRLIPSKETNFNSVNDLQCIYTSGTTGFPKGVNITQENIKSLIFDKEKLYIDSKDKMLHYSSLAFDASNFEIWFSLLNNIKIYIMDREILDPEVWKNNIRKKGVTFCWMTAGLFNIFSKNNPELFNGLVGIIVGGDQLNLPLVHKIKNMYPNLRIFNGYGPTESTTFTTLYEVTGHESTRIPIGNFINNRYGYIIGENGLPLKDGLIGELLIGGKGIARGYLNKKELTKQNFISDKFSCDNNKLYKSGDLVFRNSKGELEFIGRKDNQIKIRGYRVELEEIELIAKNIIDLKDCTLILKQEPNELLIMYYTGEIEEREVRNYLEKNLPNYMVPSHIIKIKEIPINNNGKVDKNRLLEIPINKNNKKFYITDQQQILVSIWEEVLNISNISIDDNFFEIGGDSILSIQVVSKCKEKGFNITTRDIFSKPKIRDLSKNISESTKFESKNEEVIGKTNITPIQSWFFDQEYPVINHWNQSMAWEIHKDIPEKEMHHIIEKIYQHHDALRMKFYQKDQSIIQYNAYYNGIENIFEYHDLTQCEKQKDEIETIETHCQESLNIQYGPGSKVCYMKLKDKRYRLFWTVHHLMIDGVSWRILYEDLINSINNYLAGEPIQLPMKTTSFKEYSEKLKQYQKANIGQDIKAYWLNIIDELEADNFKGETKVKQEDEIIFNEEETEYITEVLPQQFKATIEEILLAAFLLEINNHTEKTKVWITMEGHGREDFDETVDINRTVGWFTTMYPVGFELKNDFVEMLKEVKLRLRAVPRKGFEYGLVKNGNSEIIEPDISFNFLGKFKTNDKGIISKNKFGNQDFNINNIYKNRNKIEFTAIKDYNLKLHFNTEIYNININNFRKIFNKNHTNRTKEVMLLRDYSSEKLEEHELNDINDKYKKIEDIYDMTPMQRNLYDQYLLEDNTSNLVSLYFELKDYDYEKLIKSVTKTFEDNDIFKTKFTIVNEKYFGVKTKHANELKILYKNLNEKDFENLINKKEYIDIEYKGTFIVYIVKVHDKNYILFKYHHIYLDGTSILRFVEDISKEYYNEHNKKSVSIIDYNKKYYKNEKEIGEFWEFYLSNIKSTMCISTNNKKKNMKSHLFKLNDSDVNNISSKTKVTTNNIYQFLYGLTLSNLLDRKQVIFGVTVFNNEQQSIGLGLNNIPIIMNFENLNTRVENLISKVSKDFSAIFNHSLVDIDSIKNNNKKLYDYHYVFENYNQNFNSSLFDINNITGVESPEFNFGISVSPNGYVKVIYNEIFFSKKFIKEFVNEFKKMTHKVNVNLDNEFKEIFDMETTTTKNKITNNFKDYFDKYVRKNTRTAYIYNSKPYSYEDLKSNVEKASSFIREHNYRNIGVLSKNDLHHSIIMISTFYSGATLIPINSNFSEKVINEIIKESEIDLLITDQFLTSKVTQIPFKKIFNNKNTKCTKYFNNNIAYIIYTSGTTGKPKGVKVTYTNLINKLQSIQNIYSTTSEETILKNISPFFDPSIIETINPFMNGAKILFQGENKLMGEELLKFINKNQITTITLTPSILNTFEPKPNMDLQKIYCGGEKLDIKNIERWKDTNCKIFNLYGPTETTVTTHVFLVPKNFKGQNLPIGSSLEDVYDLILNENMTPTIDGFEGELYIGGTGVAAGYLNQPNLTRESFIQNPYNKQKDIIYKTGDIVKRLPNGELQFIGRKDKQVKIRGFRIELDGIKHEALKIDNVDDIVVTTDEDHQTKKLYLFYKGKANEQYIRHYLRQVLPDYMIPHFIVKVDTFPLTVNGKIDEKQLLNQNEFNSIYIEESNNEYKSIIASIFKDILNSSSVSNDKDFFELGGDSLMITRLANRLNETFNQQLSIKDLFNTSSIDGIYHLLMNRKENVELPIIPAENKKRGRLSFSQERLWFLYKTHGAKSNYNMTSFEEINNTIDIQRLREAYNQLGNYHNSLKINFKEINGTPYQFISEKELYIQVKQVNTLTEIEKIIHDETNYKFDLEKDSLTRLTLIKADGKNYLLLVQHHIISDGWSLDNFFQDLWAFYDKQLQRKLEINYIDYAEWQQQLIENHMYDDQLKFWANYLKNKELVSNLSYDFDKPKVLKYEGQSIIRKTQIKQRDINNLAQSLGVSPFILAYSLFQAFMCKYNNLPEITIGTPVSNRTHPQVERLIGFFVNNVAVNIEFENINFKDFIKKNKKNILNVFDHQEVPFDKVVDHLNVSRELNTSPIFQVMFTYENREGNSEWEKTLSQINEGTKYEISAILKPVNGNLEFMFEYSSELFKSTTIERMMLSFEYWVNQFIENPKLNLQEAKLFKANDTKELSVNSGIELKIVDTAIDLYYQNFEEHRLGVRDSNLEYTYRQIEDLSNIVSRNLNNHFMTKQNIVGVSVERNANLIPLILGILKSGNIYLPIDPSLPKQRKEFIIQDSQVDLLITGEPTEFENVSSILINEILLSNVKPLPEVSTKAELNDVAYIIYTSGTTGTPKGVKVTHLNLSNLIQWEMDKYHINQTIISQYASISFDASIWEILPALASNSTIIILEEKIKTDMEQLIPFINENGIEVLHLPSSLSEWVMEHPLHSVKYVLVGGEKLNINKKALKYPLYDHYGPTEGTVLVTSTEKSLNESCNQGIGTPITNVQTYILDDNKQLLPIGVKGELYIGGVSVSEGYLNREELTRERFIINPYKKEEVLYKTGDIVRQRDDNTIEYISRTDNQVQIRGYRIEIGEIEAIAKKIGKLDEVVVIVDGENNKQLVLYYSGTIEENELKQRLKEYLPNYMIPSFFVKLVVLPRNTNEKIDYSQLPKPKKTNKRKQIIKTEDQKLLLKIWEEVLNVSNISIDDNFFEIGGDSISTIQVVSKCKESGIHLTTKDIFSYQTVRELAEVVKKTQKLNINQDMVKGELPVTPIQSWFFDQEYPVINHWNQSMAWEIHKDIPEKEMHHIIEKIYQHHDALRMKFYQKDQSIIQYNAYYNGIENIFEYHDLTQCEKQKDEIETIETHCQESLNIQYGPGSKVCYMKLEDKRYRLFWTVHHLMIDGVSWRILYEDLINSINNYLAGEPIQLPMKTTSFKEYSEKLKQYQKSNIDQDIKAYWLNIIDELDADNFKGETKVKQEDEIIFNEEETEYITEVLPQQFKATIEEILLAAFLLEINNHTEKTKVWITMEGHGREDFDETVDINRTVGWFTTMYPVGFELKNDFVEMLKEVKLRLRTVPHKGFEYGLVKNGNSEIIEPDISFNYLGKFEDSKIKRNLFSVLSNSKNISENNGTIKKIDFISSVNNNKMIIKFQSIIRFEIVFLKNTLLNSYYVDKKNKYIPSDFEMSGLSSDDLDNLLDEL